MSLLPQEIQDVLHGPARRYFVATTLNAVGMGLTLALSLIYMTDVRHLSTEFATTIFTMNAVLGLFIAPFVGTLTDRIGPSYLLITCVVIQSAGLWQWAHANSKTTVVIASVIMVIGNSGTWGPGNVLLTRLVKYEHRTRAYGFNFMLLNVGIGLGGLISALIVDKAHPASFSHLYEGTALFALMAGAIQVSLLPHGRAVKAEAHEDATHDEGGWREVLADKRLRRFILSSIVLLICGYASMDVGYSKFFADQAHLSVHWIGVIFFFNTLTIVFGQIYVLRRMEGHSRTRMMCLVGLLWGGSWMIVGVTTATPMAVTLLLACVASCVFAVGETIWAPTSPALVNEFAPERLRGRYNAAAGATWGLSATIAPQLLGGMFSASLAHEWPYVVGIGAMVGGVAALSLRRLITPQQDGRSVSLDPTPTHA